MTSSPEYLDKLEQQCGTEPFAEETIDFLNDLSAELMGDSEAKEYPDIITFAFWCRKSNTLRMKKGYGDLKNRRGRGVSFHIAPSNIPMMFAFSLAVSLLAGNANIIRLSSKEFPQTGILCRHINCLLEGSYEDMKRRVIILNYPHDSEITQYLSERCDSRVIWGGNRSVEEIRKFTLSPYAIDLPFYDRFSFFIIDAERYLMADDKRRIAEKFYHDTYLTDQNACTSPQLVVWLDKEGDKAGQAQERFWSELWDQVRKQYGYQDIQAVDKLCTMARYAVECRDGKVSYTDMSLVRVKIERLSHELKDYRCPGGYFYEYVAKELKEVRPVCAKECQTISYYGVDRNEILDAVSGCRGVDRIVPVGDTMDFGLRWDGFDFIYSLSKIIA